MIVTEESIYNDLTLNKYQGKVLSRRIKNTES